MRSRTENLTPRTPPIALGDGSSLRFIPEIERTEICHGANHDNCGFGSMDDHKQRAIASNGGQSVPAEKRSFPRITTSLPRLVVRAATTAAATTISSRPAVDLGQQGGGGSGNFTNDRERVSEAGRKGGQS